MLKLVITALFLILITGCEIDKIDNSSSSVKLKKEDVIKDGNNSKISENNSSNIGNKYKDENSNNIKKTHLNARTEIKDNNKTSNKENKNSTISLDKNKKNNSANNSNTISKSNSNTQSKSNITKKDNKTNKSSNSEKSSNVTSNADTNDTKGNNSIKQDTQHESNNTKEDSNSTKIEPKKTNHINPNAPMMIFDDDSLTDNDIAQTFSAAMAMQSNGLINVKAIGLSGIDTNNKRSLLISSIANYYGFTDIPIAISKRGDVRKQWSPFSNYPPLIKSFRGVNRDLTQFENDGILDSQRENVIIEYCRVLSEIPEGKKISIAAMGNFYNIESLLKEKNICNGYELVRTKVSKIVMDGGTDDNSWDMNFGAFGKFHKAAVNAGRYVVSHAPVPVVFMDGHAGCGLPGGAYKVYPKVDANSPMTMVLSVRYGSHSKITNKIECPLDASVILSAALDGKWFNWDLWDEVHGDIHVDSDGRVSFRRNPRSKNIKLFPKSYTNSILNQIFIELAKFKPIK